MKKYFKNLNITHILGAVFTLWAITFTQAIIEDWSSWSDLHLYNWVLLTPGFLLLIYGGIRLLIIIGVNLVNLLKKLK